MDGTSTWFRPVSCRYRYRYGTVAVPAGYGIR